MKPSLQFSVPCFYVDEEDGGPPSFKRIFYELPSPTFPLKFPDDSGFFIANGWCNGKGSFSQSMRILKPDKKSVLIETGEQPFDLNENITPFMAINYFQGIAFPEPGTYWIQVFLSGDMKLEYPMDIRKVEGEAKKAEKK
jgi:hypothetical protein